MAMKISLSKLINNFAAFQIGWFACAYWHDTRSVVVVVMILMWLYHAEPWSKIRLVLCCQVVVLGILVDSVLVWSGALTLANGMPLLPLWLMVLWLLFSTTLTVSLKWLLENTLLAALAGAIFGPAAYWGGEQFGALFINGWQGFVCMSIGWAILMALFSLLYKRKPLDVMTFSNI